MEFGVWPKRATEEALRACADCLGDLAALLKALDENDLAPLTRAFRAHLNDTDVADASTVPGSDGGGGSGDDAVSSGDVCARPSSKDLSKDLSKVPSTVDALIAAASLRVGAARRLAAAADREPELWHAPFPGAYVARVLDGARN